MKPTDSSNSDDNRLPENDQPEAFTPDNPSTSESNTFDRQPNSAAGSLEVEPDTHPDNLVAETEPTIVQPAPKSSAKPKRRPKKLLAGGLIGLGALLLLGGGAAAYNLWYQKPEKVVMDAMSKLMTTSHLQTSTKFSSDATFGDSNMEVKLKDLSYKFDAHNPFNVDANAFITLEVDGKDYRIGGQARVIDNGEIYFQVVDAKKLVESFVNDFGAAEGVTVPPRVLELLGELENKWVKVTTDDMDEAGKIWQCTVDTAKRIAENDELSEELAKIYEDNQFIRIGDEVESRDGNLGYKISVHRDTLVTFVKATENTKASQEFKKCDESLVDSSTSSDDFAEIDENTEYEITAWISRLGHELKAVDYKVTTKQASGYSGIGTDSEDVTVTGRTEFGYDNSKSITAPEESVGFETWSKTLEELIAEVMGETYTTGPATTPRVEPAIMPTT